MIFKGADTYKYSKQNIIYILVFSKREQIHRSVWVRACVCVSLQIGFWQGLDFIFLVWRCWTPHFAQVPTGGHSICLVAAVSLGGFKRHLSVAQLEWAIP